MQKINGISDNFLYSFSNEHIIAFGVIFAIFFFFIILSIYFNHNKMIALIMIAMSLGTIVTGPFVAYELVEKTYKKTEYKSIKFRQLKFKNEAVIRGFIVNRSNKYLSDCRIDGKLFAKTDSAFAKFFRLAKPKSKASTIAKGKMLPNGVLSFTLNFKNIHYSDDLDISLKSRCR